MKHVLINLPKDKLDEYIYRYMRLDHFEQMLSKAQNVLVDPTSWDDPFENYILKADLVYADGSPYTPSSPPKIYAQCWTAKKASEAMWRIYSPAPYDKCVRIRTTPRKLIQTSLKALEACQGGEFFFGKVRYVTDKGLLQFGNSVFGGGITPKAIAETLCVKRNAFRHESERRLIFLGKGGDNAEKLKRFSISPTDLIEQVMLDPRLTSQQSTGLKSYLIRKARYSGQVLQSLLYHRPKALKFSVGGFAQ